MAIQSAVNQLIGTVAAAKKAEELSENKVAEAKVKAKADETKQSILEEKLKTQQTKTAVEQARINVQNKKKAAANLERKKAKLALENLQERVAAQREKRARAMAKLTGKVGVSNGNQ